MKLILRVVGIAISLTLVVLVGIAIVTLRSEEPAQETVVVLSPTAIEDDYAAYVERLNRNRSESCYSYPGLAIGLFNHTQ